MAARETLMPIGRFSRSCRLSIKALRHYDDEGLLKPARVDVATGYRYYARSQAREAIVIAMLRALGVGLPAIREALGAAGTERAAVLEREIGRLEREIARRQQALGTIRRIVAEGGLLPYEIGVRREREVTVATCAVTTTAERLVPDTTDLLYALFADLRAAGRDVLAPVLCMNEYGDDEDAVIVHACVGLAPPPPALATARVTALAGGPFAWLTHRGPYEELSLAYHALYAWVQDHGHEQAGLVREIYLNDPADVPSEALLTEVLMPVR